MNDKPPHWYLHEKGFHADAGVIAIALHYLRKHVKIGKKYKIFSSSDSTTPLPDTERAHIPNINTPVLILNQYNKPLHYLHQIL